MRRITLSISRGFQPMVARLCQYLTYCFWAFHSVTAQLSGRPPSTNRTFFGATIRLCRSFGRRRRRRRPPRNVHSSATSANFMFPSVLHVASFLFTYTPSPQKSRHCYETVLNLLTLTFTSAHTWPKCSADLFAGPFSPIVFLGFLPVHICAVVEISHTHTHTQNPAHNSFIIPRKFINVTDHM